MTTGRIPRVSRLMALAIKFDRLLREGVVPDQSALVRLAHVSQPRMTQILNLLHLAPDIQESLLFLPRATEGKDRSTNTICGVSWQRWIGNDSEAAGECILNSSDQGLASRLDMNNVARCDAMPEPRRKIETIPSGCSECTCLRTLASRALPKQASK